MEGRGDTAAGTHRGLSPGTFEEQETEDQGVVRGGQKSNVGWQLGFHARHDGIGVFPEGDESLSFQAKHDMVWLML